MPHGSTRTFFANPIQNPVGTQARITWPRIALTLAQDVKQRSGSRGAGYQGHLGELRLTQDYMDGAIGNTKTDRLLRSGMYERAHPPREWGAAGFHRRGLVAPSLGRRLALALTVARRSCPKSGGRYGGDQSDIERRGWSWVIWRPPPLYRAGAGRVGAE